MLNTCGVFINTRIPIILLNYIIHKINIFFPLLNRFQIFKLLFKFENVIYNNYF